MLGSDNEESAREISKMFDDPRVKQYWDPNRLVGTSYSVHVFPSHMVDMQKGMEAALPADHWWRGRERNWKNKKPEQAPLWDVAFTYDKGAKWGKTPPVPSGMVKQIFFYGEQADGATGMFFTDFKLAPADGDWIKGVASAMTQLTGRDPRKPSSEPDLRPAAPLAVGEDAKSGVIGEITVLSGSIDPLREYFNAHKDKHRFIAILSPT